MKWHSEVSVNGRLGIYINPLLVQAAEHTVFIDVYKDMY